MRVKSLVTMVGLMAGSAFAGVGDPQTKSDHPWYPGELSCSTFERLFKTESELYTRVTGRKTDTEEDKALAAWYFRNINYHHSELLGEDTMGPGKERLNREYWGGLFGYGFGLCFDTHHQFSGEIWHLLGQNRCRTLGVDGHTSFEVYLTGGAYGEGRWVALDHDIGTVVFTKDGSRMVGLQEIAADMSLLKNGSRERGWLPSSLHPSDAAGVYTQVKWSGFMTGYAGAPPIINLRAGETLRRYAQPGQEDGKTFAYWGVNKNHGQPGPDRDLTWVNQPEKMFKATASVQAQSDKIGRYGNAVYTYKPDFAKDGYKEGVVNETDSQVTLEWYSPYVIAATPAAPQDGKGGLKPGCTGGLVLKGKITCPVEVSVDQGATWQKAAETKDGMDLTDLVKGQHQYLLRLGAGAKDLKDSGLVITTVCQCNATIVPHIKAGENKIAYEATGQGYVSAGPNKAQAAAHVVDGAMDSKAVALMLEAPRGAAVTGVYAAAHVGAGCPPKDCRYNIEYSTDNGTTWVPALKDYVITHKEKDTEDWWSQAFMNTSAKVDKAKGPVLVRFSNDGGRNYMRVEAQLTYAVPATSPVKVTYAWKESGAVKTAEHVYPAKTTKDDAWTFTAGADPKVFYVEYSAQ